MAAWFTVLYTKIIILVSKAALGTLKVEISSGLNFSIAAHTQLLIIYAFISITPFCGIPTCNSNIYRLTINFTAG